VAVLEARVQELELNVRSHQTDYDIKLMEEKAMAREMTAKLAREVGKYEKELGDLNVFISKKNELENELEDTKTELLRERKKHEQIISELERKTVQEKERLRKEMETKIREAKEAFMKLTDEQLEATTKKTITENEQMASELTFQNRDTEKLLHKNSLLVEENRLARRELELRKQTEAEMARRNHGYLKSIKSLLSKLKDMDEGRRSVEQSGRNKEEGILNQYKTRIQLLQDTVEGAYKELESLRNDLTSKMSEMNRLEVMKDEVTAFLEEQADLIRQKLQAQNPGGAWIEEAVVPELTSDGGWRVGDPIPSSVDILSMPQRERLLRYLLGSLAELQIRKKSEDSPSPAGGGHRSRAIAPSPRNVGGTILPSIGKGSVGGGGHRIKADEAHVLAHRGL